MYISTSAIHKAILGLLAVGTAVNSQAISAPGHTDFSDWAKMGEFPNMQQANVTRLLGEADKLVKTDLWTEFAFRCLWKRSFYPAIGDGASGKGFIKPQKVFDNLYFIGEVAVSAWAIDTGDGLIIIDALYNGDEIEQILIPGLKAHGFDMSDVKGLIVTHEHIDHYGGAGHVQEKYGVTIYAADEAWKALNGVKGTPTRDKTLVDGQKLKFGKYQIEIYHTPGHTPGTLSLLFPVTESGKSHLAGLYGGQGDPSKAEDKVTQMESFEYFGKVVRKRRADVLLANHVTADRSMQNLPMLDHRRCEEKCHKGKCTQGKCTAKNPYIVGVDYFERYLKTMSVCVQLAAARIGQDLHY